MDSIINYSSEDDQDNDYRSKSADSFGNDKPQKNDNVEKTRKDNTKYKDKRGEDLNESQRLKGNSSSDRHKNRERFENRNKDKRDRRDRDKNVRDSNIDKYRRESKTKSRESRESQDYGRSRGGDRDFDRSRDRSNKSDNNFEKRNHRDYRNSGEERKNYDKSNSSSRNRDYCSRSSHRNYSNKESSSSKSYHYREEKSNTEPEKNSSYSKSKPQEQEYSPTKTLFLSQQNKITDKKGKEENQIVSPQMPLSLGSSVSQVKQTNTNVNEIQPSTSSIALPSYYNPNIINPNKYAEQVQKRKLLWSNKKTEDVSTKWGKPTFAQDADGKVASKFMRLMGIKSPTNSEGNISCNTNTNSNPNENIKKREEMFSTMEQQYEVARQATHTMRGAGLGFGSQLRQL